MPEKKRIRKIWTGEHPVESVDEAIGLLNSIKADLEAKERENSTSTSEEDKKPYYELIGIKIVYDVEE